MSRIDVKSYSHFRNSRINYGSVTRITLSDERLRTIAKPVEKLMPKSKKIVDDMFETMYLEEGIGLAATQVNIHQRIIVIDVSETRDQRLVLINPELLDADGDTGIEEGCLSIPEQRAFIPRAEHVKVKLLITMANLLS